MFHELSKIIGMHQTRITALNAQSNSMLELMVRTVTKYISKVLADYERDWDQQLYLFLMAWRASAHETTDQSMSNVVFGRELPLPCDLKFGFKPNEEVEGDPPLLRSGETD